MNMNKSIGSDGLHSQVPRELFYAVARSVLIIFKRLWQLEKDPKDRRNANVRSIFKKGKSEDLEYNRPVSLTLFPEKDRGEKVILETVFRHIKFKKMIGRSQHGFTKSKCLTNPVDFLRSDEWFDGYVVYFDFT